MVEMEEEEEIYWYDDGTLAGDRPYQPGLAACGCSKCDEVYTGRGMVSRLKKHARVVHGERIEIDGFFVYAEKI